MVIQEAVLSSEIWVLFNVGVAFAAQRDGFLHGFLAATGDMVLV